MAGKILFIEGAPASEASGNLLQGFEKLLEKKLGKNKPRLVSGGGKTKTIDKFLHNNRKERPYLLVDLDGHQENRTTDLQEHKLVAEQESVFYMIQEMESWFISQPDILDDYFRPANKSNPVSAKIPKRQAHEILNPKDELKKWTKETVRKSYHEIKHAIDLLERLDADKLEKDFEDFRRLIAALR